MVMLMMLMTLSHAGSAMAVTADAPSAPLSHRPPDLGYRMPVGYGSASPGMIFVTSSDLAEEQQVR
jgi:hypothetical protein